MWIEQQKEILLFQCADASVVDGDVVVDLYEENESFCVLILFFSFLLRIYFQTTDSIIYYVNVGVTFFLVCVQLQVQIWK